MGSIYENNRGDTAPLSPSFYAAQYSTEQGLGTNKTRTRKKEQRLQQHKLKDNTRTRNGNMTIIRIHIYKD